MGYTAAVNDDTSQRALEARLGEPLAVSVTLRPSALFDPIGRPKRRAEVAFVLQRRDASIWLMTKEFYPPDGYRLPTGGIRIGEPVEQALRREALEETGWTLTPSRYLARIDYRFEVPDGTNATFATHAFLLPCSDETPSPLDLSERISGFRRVPLSELSQVAETLESRPDRHTEGFGAWRDWGAFRAVVHRVVAHALEDRA